ncbi:ATP synthase subunit C lysine N-methyltransferase isoform X1 [Pelobates cultripes]|uniref:ATP synthase subunit C lysine N-methyltransferase isoform X1 n=1 Tax=Pelobates cultripes TaxID=61616 RepID=A0AAD1S2B3_PELCU|nr:ATP synthase subunit C lysine N-methyltransferase isoform X1 [Pelobates cultripes]
MALLRVGCPAKLNEIISFSRYTNVVIFGVPQMMPQLEKKLEMELDECARVIACRFPFPRWIPKHVSGEGVDTVWTYELDTLKKYKESRSVDQNQIPSDLV